MKGKKLGSLFLISILALAGIGVSYAGLTDSIYVYGHAETATVEFTDIEYSGTYVSKIYDQDINNYGSEIDVWQGMVEDFVAPSPENGEVVSWAIAKDPTDDPAIIPDTIFAGEGYEIYVDCQNLIPLIPYVADVHFTIQSIPVKFETIEYDILSDGDWDWITELMTGVYPNGQFEATLRVVREVGGIETEVEVLPGMQIHPGEQLIARFFITIPQDNDFQGLTGSFAAHLGIIQWSDPCDGDTQNPEGSIKVIKNIDEEGSNGDFDFTVTGPGIDGTSEFTLSAGEYFILSGLDLGEYTVTEDSQEGWELEGIDITGDYNSESIVGNSITFVLEEGVAEVTFDNKETEKIIDVPTDPVSMQAYPTGLDANDPSYFKTYINGNNPIPGYPLPPGPNSGYDDGAYYGWCVDTENAIGSIVYQVTLYSSYDPLVYPGSETNWSKLNWVINNKGDATAFQIQHTIWKLTTGEFYNEGNAPYSSGTAADHAAIQQLLDNADGTFVPQTGQLVGVLCYPVVNTDDNTENDIQITIIEVDP